MNLANLRSTLAAAVSFSIVLAAPGSSAWAELAKQAPGVQGARVVAAPSLPALPKVVIDGQFSVPQLNVEGVLPGAANGFSQSPVGVAPGAQSQTRLGMTPGVGAVSLTQRGVSAQLNASAKSGGQARAPIAGHEALSATQRLSAELPDLKNVSDSSAKDQSGADFMRRVGEEQSVSPENAPSVSASAPSNGGSALSAPTKAARSEQRMPRASEAQAGPWFFNPSAMFAGMFGAVAMAAGFGHLAASLLSFPIIIVSLILHEMGHAWSASKLGDNTARLQGRMSFKPRDLLTHIDPMWTLVIPIISMITSGFIFGGARPVQVNTRNFKDPVKGMALVAMAGPAVNLILAAVGAISFAALGALGAAPIFIAIAGGVTTINAMLAVFNMTPAYPFDGHHVLRWLLPARVAARVDAYYAQGGMMAWLPGIVAVMVGMQLGIFAMATTWLAGTLLGLASTIAVSLGLAAGQLKDVTPPVTPEKPGISQAAQETPAELVVIFDGAQKSLPEDAHLSFVDVSAARGVMQFQQTQQRMLAALADAGLSADALSAYNATPIGTYKRINAATLRLDASKAQAFADALRAKGHRVFPNSDRKIIIPVPLNPEDADPQARNPVTMDETLAITRAQRVHEIAAKRWGDSDGEGAIRGFFRKLFGGSPAPQPPIAVVDSGAATSHKLLKHVKTKNATSGENVDDIGHGSWVTSMVLNFAKWNRNVTHYKTFVNGGASLDDILKALTAAANDGNIVISNSWGSDDGDPKSPDSELVRKLAEEGHIMVFAAGNAGPRANTIGSPAIVTYRTADGTPRVLSVAAAGRDKKIAYFSSVGPGSPATKNQPDYPKRPDLTAIGYNTEGAWPEELGGVDRVDPVKGPVKAISGTSMSTPDVAGAIAHLAALFNVTTVGARLDAIVKAVMDTLENTAQGHDKEGDGVLNVDAAYKVLEAALGPVKVKRSFWKR